MKQSVLQRRKNQNLAMAIEGGGSAGASPSRESANTLPDRKHPAHGVKISTDQPTIIFLTVCAKERKAWMADDRVHLLLRQVWVNATAWLAGRDIIMPDHIHLFAAPGQPLVSFDNWVRYWKSQFSKDRLTEEVHRWEPDHWDTRLRDAEGYRKKWEYVRHNPVRHGLVVKPEDWPYQGSIHHLPW